MLILVIAFIAIISFLLALWSLKKQNHLAELKRVKKELMKKKIIFQRDSSK
jgi:hypothetical protein